MALVTEQYVPEKSASNSVLENMQVLEKKISLLIEIIKNEKALNAQLMEEKRLLTGQLEMVENSLLKEARSIEELNQERDMTRLVVDELIGTIDRLVQGMPTVSLGADARQAELEEA